MFQRMERAIFFVLSLRDNILLPARQQSRLLIFVSLNVFTKPNDALQNLADV